MGSDCGEWDYCGSDEAVEKLVCDDGTCAGTLGHNQCTADKPCASGFFCDTKGLCTKCDDSCATCEEAGSCTECAIGYGGETCAATLPHCVTVDATDATVCTYCERGYYVNDEDSSCTKCSDTFPDCATCSNGDACGFCSDKFYVADDGTCAAITIDKCIYALAADTCFFCDMGYFVYVDTVDGEEVYTCHQGTENCLLFNAVGACKTCNSLADGTSIDTYSYYLNDVSGLCTAMEIEYCVKDGAGHKGCEKCMDGYLRDMTCDATNFDALCTVYDDTTHVCTECIDGYFVDSGACTACYAGCKKCDTDNTLANCVEASGCLPGYWNSVTGCTSTSIPHCDTDDGAGACTTCDDGYYVDSDDLCSPCDSSCLTCDAGTSSDCLTCYPEYFESSGTCTTCGNTKFCNACSAADTCTSCLDTSLTPASNNCATGCHSSCQTCNGGATANDCVTCDPGYYLTTAAGATKGTCTACPDANCAVCAPNTGDCTLCDDGYIVLDGECVDEADTVFDSTECQEITSNTVCKTCADGYTLAAAAFDCIPCDEQGAGCSTCGADLVCTDCIEGRYSFADATDDCDDCGAGCTTCTAGVCSATEDGYTVVGGVSVACPTATSVTGCGICDGTTCSDCAAGYVTDDISDTLSCIACESPDADTTTYATSCVVLTDADGNYYTDSYTEITSCLFGTVEVPECHLPINTNCLVDLTDGTCGACPDGYTLTTGACVKDCAISGCAVCNSANDACTTCVAGKIPSSDGSACDSCDPNCVTCQGETTKCTSCDAGFYVGTDADGNANVCVECDATKAYNECYCDVGEFWDNAAATPACTSCIDNCDVCKDATTCDACANGFYYDTLATEPSCVEKAGCAEFLPLGLCETCFPPYFYDETAVACADCNTNTYIKNCALCKDANTCELCETGYYASAILNEEDSITYTNCTKCTLENCLTCSLDSANAEQCDLCADGYFWDPTNVDEASQPDPICKACSEGCDICSDLTTCEACGIGYFENVDTTTDPAPCLACTVGGCGVCDSTGVCTSCKKGFYPVETPNAEGVNVLSCSACNAMCDGCTAEGDDKCDACIANAAKDADGICTCNEGYGAEEDENGVITCVEGGSTSSAAYIFSGVLTLLVVLLAIF